MAALWTRRLQKSLWASRNRDKVRLINKRYRENFRQRSNAQAAERMRRYRSRLRAQTRKMGPPAAGVSNRNDQPG